MNKRDASKLPITPALFMDEFMRLKRGSVTRRHFLAVTGLGLAASVIGGSNPVTAATASPVIGSQVTLATWPNYHSPATFEAFTAKTGVAVEINVFGSNEDMLAKLEAGGSGWDLFVPTNYTISTYAERGLIEELDLSRIPNFSRTAEKVYFVLGGMFGQKTYALPKNWGTTGMVFNTARIGTQITSWKDFFDVAMTEADGRAIVHDYQLTTIGNALVSLGFSFNSIRPEELAKAETLLLSLKPHLYAIDSDYQPALRAGDAWLSVAWTNDAAQLNRDMPEISFALGKDGGEIWTDYYAIAKDAPNKPAAYALFDFLMDPAVAVKEHIANGTPATDRRVLALLPQEITRNRIVYPDDAALTPLEFAAAVTLTDPGRADVMARFKAA
ncbi:MAG: polyamine ABC transporter substrate-binding protein [Allorhizobium sp.]